MTGQFYDVLEIFRKNGYPSPSHHYLFNGDFVDRGSWSTEVALLLYGFKALYPDCVHLNRGNHETDNMNKVYGFEGECRSKYVPVFLLFSSNVCSPCCIPYSISNAFSSFSIPHTMVCCSLPSFSPHIQFLQY
jgi:hypothetical protein